LKREERKGKGSHRRTTGKWGQRPMWTKEREDKTGEGDRWPNLWGEWIFGGRKVSEKRAKKHKSARK